MRWYAALYRRYARTSLSTQLQYPVAMGIFVIGVILEPVLYLVVWRVAAGSQPGGQTLGGLDQNAIAAYYIVFLVVNFLTFTWFFGRIEDRVRHGSFSILLLRPVHPIHKDIAESLTYKLITATLTVPTVVFLVMYFQVSLRPSAWQGILFTVSVVLSMLMRFVLEWTLALGAFWIVRMDAIGRIYGFVMHFLGGFAAPLTLLPAAVQTVAWWSPFPWMIAFPVGVLMGDHDTADTLRGLLAQAAWLAVSLILLSVVWRQGSRRYTAVNG